MSEIERLARIVAPDAYSERDSWNETVARQGKPPIFGPLSSDSGGTEYPEVRLVRAILTAMREPSEGMLDAGSGEMKRAYHEDNPDAVWQAMIDHILAGEAQ